MSFFNKELSRAYDERNRKLSPISDNMHFLIGLILQNLPVRARILCVGVGTGAEILALAKNFPEWTFVGVDPAEPMLEVCAERLRAAGISERCRLVHGYVHDVPVDDGFDAVLSILVGHFVKREDKPDFFRNMATRLNPNGILVHSEISCDLNAPEVPEMLDQWKKIQTLMGATPESLQKLPEQMRTMLSIVPPEETEKFMMQSGFTSPIRFFQAFLICGWYARKS